MSKIVLITGCSTGIGRDLAQRLTQSGYAVAATARKVETLDDLQAGLKLPLDVTQPDSINAAVENVLHQFGRIDVLVNPASPYQTLYQQSDRFTAGMRQNETGPDAVSRVIQQAIETSMPKARYLAAVPFSGKLVLHLGDTVWDLVLRRMFKSPPAIPPSA